MYFSADRETLNYVSPLATRLTITSSTTAITPQWVTLNNASDYRANRLLTVTLTLTLVD